MHAVLEFSVVSHTQVRKVVANPQVIDSLVRYRAALLVTVPHNRQLLQRVPEPVRHYRQTLVSDLRTVLQLQGLQVELRRQKKLEPLQRNLAVVVRRIPP